MLKIEAIGFLGKDAELKTLQNGNKVINFSIAHTDRYKNSKGEQVEKTTWVECAYFTEKDGVLAFLVKGKQVYIEGTPEVRTWESNGKHGASLSVRIREVKLLGSGSEFTKQAQSSNNSQSASSSATSANKAEEPVQNLDDLPF